MTNPASESDARHDETDPTRVTDATTPEGVDGTAEGNPVAGAEIDPAERDRAVVPDDESTGGPTAGHA